MGEPGVIEGFHVRNAAAYVLPDIRRIVLRAFDSGSLVDPEDAVVELAANADNPHLQAMLWREDGEWRGLAVVILPVSRLMPHASVLHFYNAGSAALRRAMVDKIVTVVRESGYDTIETLNLKGKDAAFQRLWQPAGKVMRAGSYFTINVGGEDGRVS
ncbi:MAG: hypothetical protein ACK4RK_21990 [Gemmataceae bacterium]